MKKLVENTNGVPGMKMRNLLSISVLAFCCIGNANGGIIINLYEQGSDVVMTLSGSTTVPKTSGPGLPGIPPAPYGVDGHIDPQTPWLDFRGSESHGVESRSLDGSFPSFGTGGTVTGVADASSSYLRLNPDSIHLKLDYAGTELSGTVTFGNTTLAALGVNEGVYSQTFGGGADTVTLNAIPEPATLAFVGIFGGGLWLVRRYFPSV